VERHMIITIAAVMTLVHVAVAGLLISSWCASDRS
jgi:hypothetical protein